MRWTDGRVPKISRLRARTKDKGQWTMDKGTGKRDKGKIKGEEYDHEDEQCLGAISQRK